MKYILSLWQGHLNVIEGHFGSGVASYFRFIRGLFLLNIPVFLLTFAFVIVPQTLFRWFQQEPPGYHQNVTFTGVELLTGMVRLFTICLQTLELSKVVTAMVF